MVSPTTGLVGKIFAPALLSGFKALRRELARRPSDSPLTSFAGIDDVLDEALAVLAQQGEGFGGTVSSTLKGLIARPDIFGEPVPKQWIKTELAQSCLKAIVQSLLRGDFTVDAAAPAVELYQSLSEDAGTATPHAEFVLEAALDFLLRSLRRDLTLGERLILTALGDVRDEVSRRVSDTADLIDAHVQAQVERLRRRRFFRSAKTSVHVAELGAALIDGRLRGATASVKADALAWCARLTSSSDVTLAGDYVEEAQALGAGDLETVRVARAFVAAASDWKQALGMLDPESSLVEAGAMFHILRIGLGAMALDRLAEAGIDPLQLDPDGRFAFATTLIEADRWSEAADLIGRLPSTDFDTTPALLWVAATILVTGRVPPDLRRAVLQDIPAHPATFPLPEDDSALQERRLAIGFLDQVVGHCRNLDLPLEAAGAERYALWLKLRDPEQKNAALEQLRKRLEESGSEIGYLPLAIAFDLPVDLARAERLIDQRLARNPEPGQDVVSALVAILLEKAPTEPNQAISFLSKYRPYFASHLDPVSLLGLEVHMLRDAERGEEAFQLLSRWDESELPESLRRVFEEELGAGPSAATIDRLEDLYRDTGSTVTLKQLVHLYGRQGFSKRYLELARTLLDVSPTIANALDVIGFLRDNGRELEADAIVGQIGDLVDSSDDLLAHAAWLHFHHGRFEEAELALSALEDRREAHGDRILRYHLLRASGRWPELDIFLEKQWQARGERSGLELAQCAMLAAQLRAKRTADLIRAAVAAAPDDPNVLIGAYNAATNAGLEEQFADAANWVMRAAELSGPDGPVQMQSLQDLVDRQPEWNERVEKSSLALATGEAPIHMAAASVTMPWLRVQLAGLLMNSDEPDVRKHSVTGLFSGQRRYGSDEQMEARSIVIDRTALVTLAAFGNIDAVIAAFDKIIVTHDAIADLFDQQQRIAFHQPSRIAFAHHMLSLIDRGVVKEVQPGASVNMSLEADIGANLAELLGEAQRDDDGQRLVVHPYPITRVGSLLSEPVDLEAYSGHLCSCTAVLEALEREGRILKGEAQQARAYLTQHDRRWPDEPIVRPGATLYLSDLSISYFRYTGLLDKIRDAGVTVFVSRSELREAGALRWIEKLSDRATSVISDLREGLLAGAEQGKVVFDTAVSEGDIDEYTSALGQLIKRADHLICDDRFINRYRQFDDGPRRVSIFSSLDLLELLAKDGRFEIDRLTETRTKLRRAGILFVPLAPNELSDLIADSVCEDGKLKESGDLRAIRENIRLAQLSGWFVPAGDHPWLSEFQEAVLEVLVAQWTSDILDEVSRARSNWLWPLLPMTDWADTLGQGSAEGLANFGLILDMTKLVAATSQVEQASRERYEAWLEAAVVGPLLDSNPRLKPLFLDHLRGLLTSVVAGSPHETLGLSERHGYQIALRSLPVFLQVDLLDRSFRDKTGMAPELLINVGEHTFERKVFLTAVRELYDHPEQRRPISDASEQSWTLSTREGDGTWPIHFELGDNRMVVRGIPGLHSSAEARISAFDAMLSALDISPAPFANWRERLATARLDPFDIEDLEADIAMCPSMVEAGIHGSIEANQATIPQLVPADIRYYERLIGEGDVPDLPAYVADVVPPLLSALHGDHVERDRTALMLAAHPSILAGGRFGERSIEHWKLLGTLVRGGEDLLAKVGFVELALPYAKGDPDLEALILTIISEIRTLDPQKDGDALSVFTRLTMFVDGELSQISVLSDWPPFRRRMAALTQATLIGRVIEGKIDTDHFAEFGFTQRGWRFVVQNLVDLRKEPRWRPDYLSPSQFHNELIGRIVNAVGALDSEALTPALIELMMTGENSVTATMNVPMVFWPGPLEGAIGTNLQVPPDALLDNLRSELAQETLTGPALTLLINLETMFRIPDDVLDRAIDLVRESGPRLLSLMPPERVLPHLLGLAQVAASHRRPDLASTVRFLARQKRLHQPSPLAEELQLLLVSAAAHEDALMWRNFAGDWLLELARSVADVNEARELGGWIDTLLEIDPLLRTRCGRAQASLRLVVGA